MSKRTLMARSIQAALLVTTGAMAAGSVAQEEAVVEEVVVTGIRASMQDAMNTKRNSDTVIEAITAEDVGKFPDKNVAESLSRLPGVSVSRDFGEGEKITIRGAGPDFNRTLLNGQTVATADWFILDNPARSFNYTLLPSSLVSGLEVHKASLASVDEGSLGGTVIVNTRRPLDLDAATVNFGASASYGENSEEVDPSVNGLFSWKNDSETFGALISATRQENTVNRAGFEVLGWADTNENGIMTPTVMGSPLFVQERELTTLFASVQFAPTENMVFTLDVLDSQLDSDNMNANWLAWTGRDEDELEQTGTIKSNSTVAGSIMGGGDAVVNYINRVSSTETSSITLNFEYDTDAYSVDAAVGSTEASGGTYRETSWEYGYVGGDYSYDLGSPSMSMTPSPTDAADFGAGWIWGGEKPTTDEEQYAQVDFEVPLDMGMVTGVKFGAKMRQAERTQDRKVYSWHGPETYDAAANGDIGWNVYLQYIFNECPDLSSCGLDALGNINTGAPVGGNITDQLAQNRDVMEEIAFGGLNGVAADYAISRELANQWSVEEDTTALYVQADFETDNFRGNVGVRYVTTDQTSGAWSFSGDSWGFLTLDRDWLTPSQLDWVETDNSYSEFLPSLNIAYDLNEDMIIRGAASRVMARQNWSNLSSFESYGALNSPNPTGQAGNPNLKPFFANKLDVSYEWYYADASMFAATFFYNDQDSYQVGSTYVKPIYDQQTGQDVDVTFTRPENGPGGTATGLEFSLQHDFGGFGVQGNYAYTSTSADDASMEDKVPGVSEHTANLMGYYENDDFGARLMYNYRSDFYNGLHWNGNDLSTDAYGQIDASATWYVTDYFQLDVEALNLGNEQIVQYSEYEDRLMSVYENGRRFVISGRFSF
ncbi:TonB-dependent receptor [uncultured Umboniibacter sp.]|uniref:TonB-dependent receptor n=1 Tax=uncultured Umboniibacter sp. TaxID=1798917 RepID=UPI00260F6DDD|nr:TonB-dependent receptor [uncultured Umboniibacter sp.]